MAAGIMEKRQDGIVRKRLRHSGNMRKRQGGSGNVKKRQDGIVRKRLRQSGNL